MKTRRQFTALLGGAATVFPLGASAQRPRNAVVGLLNGVSSESYSEQIAAIRLGLSDSGYAEGRNLVFVIRSADGVPERLPTLAKELVDRKVDLIIAIGTATPAQAAKAATSTIPIIFAMGGDAIEGGLVNSLNKPGGNITGMSFASAQLAPKRLSILRELLPGAVSIGYLVNSRLSPSSASTARQLISDAKTIGREVMVFDAGTEREIVDRFREISQSQIQGILVSPDAFFTGQRERIIELVAQYAIPTIYSLRAFPVSGGLMSYGIVSREMYKQTGTYAARVLNGEKTSELPVQQPTKFEFVINLKTAKAFKIEIPPMLLARADEVIE